MSKHTYKDELYERLKVAFPNLNGFKIMRIAEDIMKNPSNNPSILCKERIIVESWDCEFKDN